MNYNKEEVIKTFRELFPYITDEEVIATPNQKDDNRSGDILTILMRNEAKKLNTFLSTALDSAYKAGREEMEKPLREALNMLEDEIPFTGEEVIAKIKEALK